MADKYIMPFGDINGDTHRIRISPSGYVGSSTELQPSDVPCMINYDSTDDKFGGVTGSECQIQFFSDGNDFSDLFVTDPIGTSVVWEREYDSAWYVVWSGYINPETFTEEYKWSDSLITIVANDGLAAMDRIPYFESHQLDTEGYVINPLSLGVASVSDILTRCFSDLILDRINVDISISGENSELLNLQVDLANFVDEDQNGQSKREVLNWLCESFTLNLHYFASTIWMLDPSIQTQSVYTYYDVYDNQFNLISQEQHTVIDLGSATYKDVFEFSGGSQTLEYKAGFDKITTNYSPYATVNKLNGCSDLDGLGITNPPPWKIYRSWVRYYYLWGEGAIKKTAIADIDFEDDGAIQMEDTTNQSFLKPAFCVPSDDGIGALDKDSSNRYVGLINSSSYVFTPADVNSESNYGATMNGGYLPKNTDTISVSFDSYFTWDIDSNPEIIEGIDRDRIPTNVLRVGFIIKCGDKWAVGGQNWDTDAVDSKIEDNVIEFTSSIETIVWFDIYSPDADNVALNATLSFSINGIAEGGVFSMKSIQNHRVCFTKDVLGIITEEKVTIPYKWAFGIKDPEVSINGYAFNDDDVELDGSTSIDFKNDKKIDINISSKRDQGCLDRACFINELGEQESAFRRGTGSYTNLAECIIQGYLGNYKDKYKSLNATLICPQILRKFPESGAIPSTALNPSGIMTPVTKIRDSVGGITNNMIFRGGSFDARMVEVSGTWVEVFPYEPLT